MKIDVVGRDRYGRRCREQGSQHGDRRCHKGSIGIGGHGGHKRHEGGCGLRKLDTIDREQVSRFGFQGINDFAVVRVIGFIVGKGGGKS